MTNNNGNSTWVMYLVGVLVSLTLFVALPALAANMINNDRIREEQDREIRKEISEVKDVLNNKLDRISSDVAYIKARVK